MAEITENVKIDVKTNKVVTEKIIRDGNTETVKTYETKNGKQVLVKVKTKDIK